MCDFTLLSDVWPATLHFIFIKKYSLVKFTTIIYSILQIIDFESYRKWLARNEELEDYFFMSYYNSTKNY